MNKKIAAAGSVLVLAIGAVTAVVLRKPEQVEIVCHFDEADGGTKDAKVNTVPAADPQAVCRMAALIRKPKHSK